MANGGRLGVTERGGRGEMTGLPLGVFFLFFFFLGSVGSNGFEFWNRVEGGGGARGRRPGFGLCFLTVCFGSLRGCSLLDRVFGGSAGFDVIMRKSKQPNRDCISLETFFADG